MSTKDSSILYHLLKRKFRKSRFSGKTNSGKQLHYNIREVQDSVFHPQGTRAYFLKGAITKSDVRPDTAMFYADTSKS